MAISKDNEYIKVKFSKAEIEKFKNIALAERSSLSKVIGDFAIKYLETYEKQNSKEI